MPQILEKTWKNWQSMDPSVGFKGQFQHSRNIDISNIKNGITLSSAREEATPGSLYTYCPFDNQKLVRFQKTPIAGNYPVIFSNNTEWPLTSHTINNTTSQVDKAITFRSLVYGFGIWYACTVVPTVWWAITDITAWITWTDPDTATVYNYSKCNAVMNYSNSMILVADGNILRRYVPVATPSLPIWWKVIRVFEDDVTIKGLTMEWSYLKIWVQDSGLQTKVHYATGTFDMEYSWLVQTINLEKQVIVSVESDTIYDYALCRNSVEDTTFYLYRLQWTNKTLIKKTLVPQWSYRTDFTYPDAGNMQIKKGILYNPMGDGIRTFRNESISSGLSSWIVSAPALSRAKTGPRFPVACVMYGNYLYISYQYWVGAGTEYKEVRVYTEFRPPAFIEEWYVIGLINDWWLMGFDKMNTQLNLSYLLPQPTLDWTGTPTTDPWKIRVYLRYDREWLDLGTWWELIKTIDNYTTMRERILLTEIESFRRDRNVCEYRIEIERSETNPEVAPTFYEYDHIYDFTNRLDAIQEYTPYTP